MNKATSSRYVVGALIALAAVAAAALLLATLSSGSSDAAPSPSKQEFAILASPTASARAALPLGAKKFLASREDPGGLSPATEPLSGLGSVETSTGEVTVAQFGQTMCMSVAAEHQAETCGSLSSAENGRLFLLFPSCEKTVIVGVLPDGARGVSTVATTAATPTAIAAKSNVYVTEIPSTDTTLSGATASGTFSVSLSLDRVGQSPACG